LLLQGSAELLFYLHDFGIRFVDSELFQRDRVVFILGVELSLLQVLATILEKLIRFYVAKASLQVLTCDPAIFVDIHQPRVALQIRNVFSLLDFILQELGKLV
jgi:hypothetical protein